MCYVTLRGLVYFGASIHLYNGVQMLVNMYYDLFATSVPKLVTVSTVDILFNCTFFALGVLIFRGVEQQSKNFIKWPTIGFTLLLASRFLIEIVKQMEGEGPLRGGTTLSPFSYSSMSVEVDPLISAAVGIYIFILFVYNHSLEYAHTPPTPPPTISRCTLPRGDPRSSSFSGSEGAQSDGSDDTVQLISTQVSIRIPPVSGGGGEDSNNNGGVRGGGTLNGVGGGGPMSTISNPLFELDNRGRARPHNLSFRNSLNNCARPLIEPSQENGEKIEAV